MTEKKIKVMLLQTIAWLWKKDEIKEVTPSYATNYLLSKKLAIIFSKDKEIQLKQKEGQLPWSKDQRLAS